MISLRYAATTVLTVAAVGSATAACGGGTPPREFTGVVTTVGPNLCLGAPRASGRCFVRSADLAAGLRRGDCVLVRYRAPDRSRPLETADGLAMAVVGLDSWRCS